MGKAEVGTPKYLANKMKAKGLQKLRWYCQMCQKQCRDENGFKCHTMSESHQRQLLLFADNSRKYMDEFSYDFSKGFMEIIRRQFGTKRVAANRVYQEYISDRNHLHMNATRWVTLTGYVKYLGKSGKCIVDETDKGWFITYIDREPDTIAKEERRNKKIRMDKDDEERAAEFIDKQVKLSEERASTAKEVTYTELKRENDDKIALDIKLEPLKPKVSTNILPLKKLMKLSGADDTASVSSFKSTASSSMKTKPLTAIEELMQEEERQKEKSNRKDYWITENIVVKVATKSLGDDFYKQKGVIVEVRDKYTAVVKLIDSGKKLKLDQEHLESVIPAIGKHVRIVNGGYRGEKATLKTLNEKRFCVDVVIASGPLMGRQIEGVQYEDICKLYTDI